MSYRSITLIAIIAALSVGASPKDKKFPKNDPDAIGNRRVGQGVNFYSVEKEIALGKQLAKKSSARPRWYDPASFVDFFEKLESLKKRKPDSVAKVFSTHPMTDDRIKTAQEEIEKDLPARPEYVVNISEFNDVKARIAMLHGKRKLDTDSDPNGPTLRRSPGSGTGPVDANNDDGKPKPDQDERPTLKRRDGDNN